jgi:hypothetical protein
MVVRGLHDSKHKVTPFGEETFLAAKLLSQLVSREVFRVFVRAACGDELRSRTSLHPFLARAAIPPRGYSKWLFEEDFMMIQNIK